MPYSVVKNHSKCPDSKPWAVRKTDDGKIMGCHESKQDAIDQIGAIESSERRKG